MKYKFGKRSEAELATIKSALSNVCRRALKYGEMDATVIQGRRSKTEQNRYFKLGKSRVEWPYGKHNVAEPEKLAGAVDIVPCVNAKPSWNPNHCLVWAGLMLAAAAEEGVKIRWGGNWDRDGEPITDQDFQDLAHFELVGD